MAATAGLRNVQRRGLLKKSDSAARAAYQPLVSESTAADEYNNKTTDFHTLQEAGAVELQPTSRLASAHGAAANGIAAEAPLPTAEAPSLSAAAPAAVPEAEAAGEALGRTNGEKKLLLHAAGPLSDDANPRV